MGIQMVGLAVTVASAVWVGFDSSRRDFSNDRFANSTTKWVIGTLLLWIIAFPIYLVRRGRAPLKAIESA